MKKLLVFMFAMLPVAVRAQSTQGYTAKAKETVNYCNAIDVEKLKGIQAAMVATSVVSGISAGGNIFSSVVNFGGMDNANAKTNKGKGTNIGQGMGIAAAVASGIGTAGSVSSTAMTGASLADLQKIIENVQACQDGLKEL